MKSGVTTAKSEKYFKQKSNRKYRHKIKTLCRIIEDFDDVIFPVMNEVSEIWDGAKYGKCWHDKFWLKPRRVYYPLVDKGEYWVYTGFYLVYPTLFEQLKMYYKFFSK
jgi:hypothetical protein